MPNMLEIGHTGHEGCEKSGVKRAKKHNPKLEKGGQKKMSKAKREPENRDSDVAPL